MKYRLRTLLILTIFAPPLLAGVHFGIEFLIGFSQLPPLDIPKLPPPVTLRIPISNPKSPSLKSTDAPESTWKARDELPLFAQCNQPLSLFNRVIRSQTASGRNPVASRLYWSRSVVSQAARKSRMIDRQLIANIPCKFV
jgi:hypothetical protein